jgi:hypothetical protein
LAYDAIVQFRGGPYEGGTLTLEQDEELARDVEAELRAERTSGRAPHHSLSPHRHKITCASACQKKHARCIYILQQLVSLPRKLPPRLSLVHPSM